MNSQFDHITFDDYQKVAGPDWPTYQQFQTQQNIPNFVLEEIASMLRPQQGFTTDTFCVLPFYGWEYPHNTACCLLPANVDLVAVKSDMLNNRRSPACAKCWSLEDQNLVSDRQIKNAALDYYSNTDLEQLVKLAQDGKAQTIHYKIDTGNTCNATCVTCSDKWSSSWASLNKKNNLPSHKTWRMDSSAFGQNINWKQAKSMGFRGGEPLLSQVNFWILEQLLKHNNTDCFVNFTTNGSVTITDYQIKILKQFKSVNFCYSIDGIGPVFEYLRWPLAWQQIQDHLDRSRKLGFGTSVSYTLSNLNVWYHDQTIDWFKSRGLNYICNPVYKPHYFSPSMLPVKVKQSMIRSGKCLDIIEMLQPELDPGALYQEFWAAVRHQDNIKKSSIEQYLPGLVSALNLVDQ